MPLAPHTFLGRLGPEGLDRLEAAGRRVRHRAGSALFVEGDHAGHVLVVLEGRVKVFSSSSAGREVVLAIRGPGDLIGELASIDGVPRSASGVAIEPVELLVIEAERFLRLVSEDDDILMAMLRTVSQKLRDADRTRVEFGSEDTTTRVAGRLAELAGLYGVPCEGGTLIDLPMTQLELAEWVGASREAVTKALQVFRDRGIVSTARRSIVVHDLDALAARGHRPANA